METLGYDYARTFPKRKGCTVIFYFSSTGNCKYVAVRVSKATGDETRPIPDCLREGNLSFSLAPGENLGLVVPVYFGGFPKIVAEFLDKLEVRFSADNYVFFVGTYGSGAGGICKEAVKRMGALGKAPDATFSLKMVDNYIPYFDMTDKEYVATAEAEAEPVLAGIVQKIASRVSEYDSSKDLPAVMMKKAAALYEKACDTGRFSVSNACIGCGLCGRQCPVDAIEVKDGRPIWVKAKCTLCLGCVHRCPTNAISYTEKTIGHGQYFNPNVKPDRR